MRYLLGFIFCFLSVFVMAGNNPNTVKANDYHFELLQNSGKTNSLEDLLPTQDVVLVDVKISGKVQQGGIGTLSPFAGVTVTFSGLGSVVTNDTGYYEKFVPEQWTGTVTPYYCGYYIFSPASRTYTKIKVNAANQDFVGTPAQMFTINGTIIETINNSPLADYAINFGNGYTATTNSQGQYSIQVKPCGSYTLTPTSADYNFVPLSRNYPNITADFYDQDYEATPSSFPLPPGWDYTLTGSAHIISVMPYANPTICDVPLNEGDWIGVFYVGDDSLLHCGGAGMYQGTTVSTAVIAQGDDFTTPEKDGFSSFEVMNWKVYSSSTTQQEFIAFPTTFSGDSYKWGSMGLTRIISLPAYKTHNLVIPQGWSGISSYLKPAISLPYNNIPSMAPRSGGDSIRRIMMPIVSKLTIVQNLTKTYWPSQNVNTIGKWSATSGYKIKVTEPLVLPVHGCDYSPRTISLVTGWNLIPVISECDIPIDSLFAAHLNKITIIKEVAGSFIYWPAMNIKTLLTLQTGKAYLMMVSSDFSVTFPACAAFKDQEILQTPLINNSPWNDPVMTPSNHSIALPSGVMGKLMAGDVIGAFTNDGICAGLVQIDDLSANVLLQVFGDDQTTLEKDGFDESEFLNFKLFRLQLNQEFEIGFDFDADLPSSDGVFATDGLSAVGKIVFNPTYIGEHANNSISFFPNPANGFVEFVAGDSYRKFNVTILDLTGQKVDETSFSGKTMIDVSDSPKGIYLVKIESNDFIKFEKLIIQ